MTHRRPTPERLGAPSDGVFEVIMVLELKPPSQPSFAALLPLCSTGLSYAVSYLFIAIVLGGGMLIVKDLADGIIYRCSRVPR